MISRTGYMTVVMFRILYLFVMLDVIITDNDEKESTFRQIYVTII